MPQLDHTTCSCAFLTCIFPFSLAALAVEENVIAKTDAVAFGRGRIYTIRMQVHVCVGSVWVSSAYSCCGVPCACLVV